MIVNLTKWKSNRRDGLELRAVGDCVNLAGNEVTGRPAGVYKIIRVGAEYDYLPGGRGVVECEVMALDVEGPLTLGELEELSRQLRYPAFGPPPPDPAP